MAYNGKTNWQLNEIVKPEDMNRIEQGVIDAHENLLTHKTDTNSHMDIRNKFNEFVKGVTGSNATLTITKGNGTTSLVTVNNVANAAKATQDSMGQQINSTYIKGLSVSGKTITYTKGNGTSGTITTQDTVYTHPNSGAKAGTYKSVTVNAQGHVTGGSNPTTLAGYGITDGVFRYALGSTADKSVYTMFAGCPADAGEGNISATILLTQGGNYGGAYQGAWLIQISTRGGKYMSVKTLRSASSSPTFGYYVSGSTCYFGALFPAYRGDCNVTVLSSTGCTLKNFGDTTTAPSGWTAVASELMLDSGNYNSYAPTKTGDGASGTWGINITGNAASATTADKVDSGQLGSFIINKPGYNDYSPTVGGPCANVTIDSWFGVSFTSQSGGSVPKGTTAVGIDCREGIVRAKTFVGHLTGTADSATNASHASTADSATNADTVDGIHAASLFYNKGIWASDNWATTGAYQVNGNPPISNAYNYGQVISSSTEFARFQLYATHQYNYDGRLHYRTGWDIDNFQQWNTILDSENYNLFAPTKTGSGASGTWGINITGNANNATNDSAGQQINTTYIKGLSISGNTITYTKGNGGTGSITVPTGAGAQGYIVESKYNADGSWYRKWSDGWLEQGGNHQTTAAGMIPVNFVKPFSALPYGIITNLIYENTNWHMMPTVSSVTKTSFKYAKYSEIPVGGLYWYAYGKA